MATICRRLKDPLVYLEQVRQHLGRLPSIDPNTRTLLICGYPNVGKSSFLKSITRADVDVQPYAFTTKSLFVGHFDYKYLRFQAIDTPGILDHPLEEMNTIEMQSITAIAHLRSAILYFMDLSEQCGYTVQAQIQLFQSIKPLFANKLVFIVINKIDVMRPEDLDAETKAKLDAILKPGDVELLQLSCTTTEGVTEVKNAACERLIADRVAQKLKAGTNTSGTIGSRLGDVLTRIHVAQPLDGVLRESYIPDAVKALRKFDKDDPNRRRLAREIEEAEGGAGVFNIDLRERYLLNNEDWKHDKVPEVFLGKNVYDFIDPDIEAKLASLEEEEEKLQADGYYDTDDSIEDAEEADIRGKAELIRDKRQLIRNEAKMKKSLKNRAIIPRSSMKKKLSTMEDSLDRLGYDTTALSARARSQSRGRSVLRSRTGTEDAMDVDTPNTPRDTLRAASRARSQSNRREDGVTSLTARSKADRLAKLGQQKMNRMARQGEADRHVPAAMPKHLVSFYRIKTLLGKKNLISGGSFLGSVRWARLNVVEASTFSVTSHDSALQWRHRIPGYRLKVTVRAKMIVRLLRLKSKRLIMGIIVSWFSLFHGYPITRLVLCPIRLARLCVFFPPQTLHATDQILQSQNTQYRHTILIPDLPNRTLPRPFILVILTSTGRHLLLPVQRNDDADQCSTLPPYQIDGLPLCRTRSDHIVNDDHPLALQSSPHYDAALAVILRFLAVKAVADLAESVRVELCELVDRGSRQWNTLVGWAKEDVEFEGRRVLNERLGIGRG